LTAQLTFLGATDHVTGSKTLLTSNSENFLIDCGLFQGDSSIRARNWNGFSLAPESLTKIILTHAHLDHCGYLPRLVKAGFKEQVWCTSGTQSLCNILLRDAAYLEEENARYFNEKHISRHAPALPLFTREDAEQAIERIIAKPRHEWLELQPGLSCRFLNAGHIIGASMVEFSVQQDMKSFRITFSGDLGHSRSKTIRDPEFVQETDLLILESTYGDRLHDRGDVTQPFAAFINKVVERKGVLVIPAFAVGRSQEILFLIKQMEDSGQIPQVPVILDSPMSAQATKIFFDHPEDNKLNPAFYKEQSFVPAKLETTQSSDESMLITMRDGPMIVISAAGMLSGGRILHHLKNRLPDERNGVLFTGYQAEGSKGRYLQDHSQSDQNLRIHKQEVPIRAEVATLDGLSAHADYEDILHWISKITKLPKLIALIHGSEAAKAHLGEKIRTKFGIRTIMPKHKEVLRIPDCLS
jgi:metallo-beta-lactamase family protein